MKKRNVIIVSLFLMVIVMSCSVGPLTIDLGGGGGDDAPESESAESADIEVGINAPANGAALPDGPVEIAYYATSTDGISALELSVNGEVLDIAQNTDSEQLVLTANFTWEPEVSGSHTIRVRAMSGKGSWSDYASATVNVEAPPAPAQPTATKKPDATKTPDATATPEKPTIFNVEQDVDEFFFNGQTCGPREVTISADITHPDEIYSVSIYVRFWDNEGEGLTSWDGGRAMSRKSDTHFSRTMFSEDIPNYNQFEFNVMYYQLVAENEKGERVAATEVFKRLQLNRCP